MVQENVVQSIMRNYNEYFRVNICERKDTNIRDQLPNISGEFLSLPTLTKGQSQSALQAVEKLTSSKKIDHGTPITIATCDSDIVPDWLKLSDFLNDKTDLLVWTNDHYVYAHKNPSAYGWVTCVDDTVTEAFVKTMPEGEASLITGNFTFRNATTLKTIISYQQEHNICTNNEYYLDDCVNIAIKLGFTVKKLNVERFASWGTPDELKTYQYWQSAFSTWTGHPYSVSEDRALDVQGKMKLETEVRKLEIEINGSTS
jgi:bifunctional N-acetylglucosamine-1-phosphate-uridyltransferase/glucosamine-1-phosphate-acetyltransferase GlmU-like protein